MIKNIANMELESFEGSSFKMTTIILSWGISASICVIEFNVY